MGGVRIGTPQLTNTSAGTVKVYAHISREGEVLPTSEWVPGLTKTIEDSLGGSFRIMVDEYTTYPPREWRLVHRIQRLDSAGQTLWQKQVFSEDSPPNSGFAYIADGTGGFIMTYHLQKESLPYQVMALRLDADGSLVWGDEGLPVFDDPAFRYQENIALYSDASGGAIMVTLTGRGALSGDMIYTQRLDTNGNRLWDTGIRIDQ